MPEDSGAMSDAGTPPTPPITEATPPLAPPVDETDWKGEAEKAKAEADALRALARKHEDRAKANGNAAKELETLRRQTMTEAEKQIAEARAAGRTEALLELGHERVTAEFRAQAVGRLDQKAIDVLVARLNVAAFVREDGTIDSESIGEFVSGITPPPPEAPPPDPRFPELGQGQRSTPSLNGEGLESALRAAVGLPT